MVLTRTQAKTLCAERASAPLDLAARPIEAGMGGCPWRVAIACLLARGIEGARRTALGEDRAAKTLEWLLRDYPTPHLVAQADERQVLAKMVLLSFRFRRMRAVVGLSKAWVGEDWNCVLDLPFVRGGRVVGEAIERYAG